MFFCDSHIHLSEFDLKKLFSDSFFVNNKYLCCVNFLSKKEFLDFSLRFQSDFILNSYCKNLSSELYDCKNHILLKSFGIHPESCCRYTENEISEQLIFLEDLLKNKKINLIGECGLDFFTKELKSCKETQMLVWIKQLLLAEKYNVPVLIHSRKSIEYFFHNSKLLSKIPAVIFHSFPGTFSEAVSLLNHNINCYFSFGKQLLNNKKSAIDCVKELNSNRILLETDAPFQTLKGERKTMPQEIERVYLQAAKLRNESLSDTCSIIYRNFLEAFYINEN